MNKDYVLGLRVDRTNYEIMDFEIMEEEASDEGFIQAVLQKQSVFVHKLDRYQLLRHGQLRGVDKRRGNGHFED